MEKDTLHHTIGALQQQLSEAAGEQMHDQWRHEQHKVRTSKNRLKGCRDVVVARRHACDALVSAER